MWVIKSITDFRLCLVGKESFMVGRKNADVLITSDPSISRNHAAFILKENMVILKDQGSKYGTFVNGKKLEPEIKLKHGDKIKFGAFNSLYTIEEMIIIITTSTLSKSERNVICEKVKYLQGTVIDVWREDCTFVTVKEIVLTPKVLCALIKGIPVVTPQYWHDFVNCVRENKPLPNTSDYRPPLGKSCKTASWDYNPDRSHLFKNKVFVFTNNRDMAQMQELVQTAGGKCMEFRNLTTDHLKCKTPEYLIVSNEEIPKGTKKLNDIMDLLKHENKRVINLQEIALAIVACSCEKDCNPNFNKTGSLIDQNPILKFTQNILAPATQTQDAIRNNSDIQEKTHIIPSTLEDKLDDSAVEKLRSGIRSKRPRDVLDTDYNITKHQKTEHSNENNNQNTRTDSSLHCDKICSNEVDIQNNMVEDSTTRKRKYNESTEDNISFASTSRTSANPFLNVLGKTKQQKLQVNIQNTNVETSKEHFNIRTNDGINESKLSDTYQTVKQSFKDSFDNSKIKPEITVTEGEWLNKTGSENVSVKIKEEIDGAPDPLQAYIDSFKNVTLTVHCLPVLEKKKNHSTVHISNDTMNGKNFKKFFKVAPVKPQRTIITPPEEKAVTCGISYSTDVLKALNWQ